MVELVQKDPSVSTDGQAETDAYEPTAHQHRWAQKGHISAKNGLMETTFGKLRTGPLPTMLADKHDKWAEKKLHMSMIGLLEDAKMKTPMSFFDHFPVHKRAGHLEYTYNACCRNSNEQTYWLGCLAKAFIDQGAGCQWTFGYAEKGQKGPE